jgi:hypothetical protein
MKQNALKADKIRYTALGSQNFICQKCISGSSPSRLNLQVHCFVFCHLFLITSWSPCRCLLFKPLYILPRWQPTVNMAMRKAAPPYPSFLKCALANYVDFDLQQSLICPRVITPRITWYNSDPVADIKG